VKKISLISEISGGKKRELAYYRFYSVDDVNAFV
jgi:hypothetical protein